VTYVDEVLADSPRGYWRLGEGGGITAASQTNTPALDGTYLNTPTLGVAGALVASGDSNTACSFSRASQESVQLPDGVSQPLMQLGDVLTIEAWVKRASTGGYHYIFFNGDHSAAFRIDDSTNFLHVDKAIDAAIVSSTVAITDTTTWHHCIYTKDGATSKIYLDSVDVTGSVTNATLNDSGQNSYIGNDNTGSNGFDGAIDEVAVYATALSAARVIAHYNAATQIPMTAPQQLQPRRGGTGRW